MKKLRLSSNYCATFVLLFANTLLMAGCTISGQLDSESSSATANPTSSPKKKAYSPGQILQVDIGTAGETGNAALTSNQRVSISSNGRYIAFESSATNLVLGDTNSVSDIFVHDLDTRKTVRISQKKDGTQSNGSSTNPFISGDGRYVVFDSVATNLVADDNNSKRDVFIADLSTGEISLVSTDSSGALGNGDSAGGSISDSADKVSFHSNATNLVSGISDTNSTSDIYFKDLKTGQVTLVSNRRVSGVKQNSTPNNFSLWANLSRDGSVLSFYSNSSNLLSTDSSSSRDVLWFLPSTDSLSFASVNSSAAQASADAWWPRLSRNGEYCSFHSSGSNLVSGDLNAKSDIFRRSLNNNETIRVSVSVSGGDPDNNSGESHINDDGNNVVFESIATNLIDADTNSLKDVFMRDISQNKTTRLSVNQDGTELNGPSTEPMISGDASRATFLSTATNIANGSSDGLVHLYVKIIVD